MRLLLLLCLLTGCEFCGVDARVRKHYVCVVDGHCDSTPEHKVISVCAPTAESARDYMVEYLDGKAEGRCETWDYPNIDCTIYEEDKYCDI